jgi:hypothetical protein
VQAYFAGHDHNLEHIRVPGSLPHYLITGGGSKTDRAFIGAAHSLFQWPSSGFVSVELSVDELVAEFLGYGSARSGSGDDLAPMYTARIQRQEGRSL